MRQVSLRSRLLLRLLVPMCTVLLVSGMLSYILALHFARASSDRSLLETARWLAQQVHVRDSVPSVDLPRPVVGLLLWDGEEHIRYQVASKRLGIIAGDRELPKPTRDGSISQPAFYDGQMQGEAVRAVSLRVSGLPDNDDVTIRVAETRRISAAITGDIVGAVVLPQLILILLAALAIWGGVRTGLGPLERLARAVDRRRRDDPKPLPVAGVPLEVKPLIDAFNGLLGRLGEALAAQQRFIADAAHQLRTPLAALKVQIERTLREHDARARDQSLQQLLDSVDRIARLSNQLLLLARSEPEGGVSRLVRLDLRGLAFEVGSEWVPRALQRGRDLGFAGDDGPVWVVGDALLLGELINNLLDNALHYGGPHITLAVGQATDGVAELSVEDDGPGIAPEERVRVFERFHRAPGSVGNGSGLGLSIVREIARNHGATVMLETPQGGGIRVRLRFARDGRAIEPGHASAGEDGSRMASTPP